MEAEFDEYPVVLLCRTFVVYNRAEYQFGNITFRDKEMHFRKGEIMGGHILEFVLVALVGLAIFGPKTLQALGRNAGKSIGQRRSKIRLSLNSQWKRYTIYLKIFLQVHGMPFRFS